MGGMKLSEPIRESAVDGQHWLSSAGIFRYLDVIPIRNGKRGKARRTVLQNRGAKRMGLIDSVPWDVGAQFECQFMGSASMSVRLMYTIVDCKQLKPGAYAIGAELMAVD